MSWLCSLKPHPTTGAYQLPFRGSALASQGNPQKKAIESSRIRGWAVPHFAIHHIKGSMAAIPERKGLRCWHSDAGNVLGKHPCALSAARFLDIGAEPVV